MELSAKTGQNVQEAFTTMVAEIYRRLNKGVEEKRDTFHLKSGKRPKDNDAASGKKKSCAC